MVRRWAIDQCRKYFGLGNDAEVAIRGLDGKEFCLRLWLENPATWDANPLSILRQEWFHAADTRYKPAGFWGALPIGSRVLDYGCGTGEVARLPWIARHEAIVLVDQSQAVLDYLFFKYQAYAGAEIYHADDQDWRALAPFDGLICTDMLEHVSDPMGLFADLWSLLAVGGHALLSFETAQPHAGHLAASIAQHDVWCDWVQQHAIIIEGETYLWVKKTT